MKRKYGLLVGLAFSFLILATNVKAQGDPRFAPIEPVSISVPQFAMGSGEVVESFSCTVFGSILRVNVPYLWEMEINNGLASRAELKAGAIEGEDEIAEKDLASSRIF